MPPKSPSCRHDPDYPRDAAHDLERPYGVSETPTALGSLWTLRTRQRALASVTTGPTGVVFGLGQPDAPDADLDVVLTPFRASEIGSALLIGQALDPGPVRIRVYTHRIAIQIRDLTVMLTRAEAAMLGMTMIRTADDFET